MSKKVIVVAVSALAFPSTALAHSPTSRHIGVYNYLRRHVVKDFGPRAAGRDILKDGLATRKHVTDATVVKSIHVYQRLLWPPYVPPVVYSAPPVNTSPTYSGAPARPTYPSSSSSSYGGGYSIPSGIVQCESGGNWNAVNPSSGAGGAYQILPSTWQAYGGQGLPQDASPAQQSQIAAKIWATAGPSQWSCK